MGISEISSGQLGDISKLDKRQRGQLAELAFMRKAASLGFAVSRPWQEGERYDVIVRADSTLWRVQVKSALNPRSSRPSYCVATTAGRDYQRSLYSSSEIDFLAAYIFAKDVWYIFPVDIISKRRSVWLRPESAKCRHRQYHEAWDLLKPKLN